MPPLCTNGDVMPEIVKAKPNKKLKVAKQRIWELDFLRGICVLLMIFDHMMYNISDVFGGAWAALNGEFFQVLYDQADYYIMSELRYVVRDIVVWIFAILCGISCTFSRSNLKRGLFLAIIAFVITIVTDLFGSVIKFGILHSFAVGILAWWLIDLCCRHKKIATAFVCLIIGMAIILINESFMAIYKVDKLAFVDNSDWYFLGEFMLGDRFFSADYYPIFPTVGYMLIGASVAPFIYPFKKSLAPKLGKLDWYRPFSFWGRIALPTYVLHQVIITSLFALISYLFLTPGNFIVI